MVPITRCYIFGMFCGVETQPIKNKVKFTRKYMKYFIIFLKNVRSNSVHNAIHKTFVVSGCREVACSGDDARDFNVIHALSPLRTDAREAV